eukprot:3666900-Rhodomonas_salina.1
MLDLDAIEAAILHGTDYFYAHGVSPALPRPTYPLRYTVTHSCTHSLIHHPLLPPSLAHSLTYSLTHSLTPLSRAYAHRVARLRTPCF